ncbi:uncharacterized protein V6R79_018351 [Siganus canaliculatus]
MQTSQGINTVSAAVYAVCGRHGYLATKLKILVFILPICEMVVGALFYSGCQDSLIPTFLLVLGVLSLPLAVNVVLPKLIREPTRTVWIVMNFLAVLGWFIAGHVWIFQPFPHPYCSNRLYGVTINFVGINYLLLFLFIMYICLYCHRRHYRVKNQQSGTYIDVNTFYKQNMNVENSETYFKPGLNNMINSVCAVTKNGHKRARALLSVAFYDRVRAQKESEIRTVCAEVPRLALSVAEITMGALYLDECPREPYIPIYLMVLGIFGLTNLLFFARTPEDNSSCKIFQIVLSLAHLGWFIAGNVWIYSIYEPNYNKDPASTDLYCNKTLYLFAFWITTLSYILLGVYLLCVCPIFCCTWLYAKASNECLNSCKLSNTV